MSKTTESNVAERDVVIFDLDDTLADTEWRVKKHLGDNPKPWDWDAFFADCPDDGPHIDAIAVLNAMMAVNYEIWIITGRSAAVHEQTVAWLDKYGIDFNRLIMRPVGDHTQDDVLKIRWIDEHNLRDRVLVVFEDRQRVVDAWRKEGISCFQVRPGKF